MRQGLTKHERLSSDIVRVRAYVYRLPEQERLQVPHIIIRRSDKVHLQAALLTVCKKKRPKFRHVSVTQVANPKIPNVSLPSSR